MRAICVDDERLLMEDTVSLLGELPQIDTAKGFTRAAESSTRVRRLCKPHNGSYPKKPDMKAANGNFL